MPRMRKARIFGITRSTAEAYLPANYVVVEILPALRPGALTNDVLIAGEDKDGWTLDGYIIPRLESGLYHVEEIKP